MDRIFSGMQPTGLIHLGNYLGAIKNWVALQDKYECIFSIVDLHALTIEQDPQKYPQQVLDLALDYLALGVDPPKCTLFIQSHVPEHTELAWILNTLTPMGDLQRMTQYKEKSQQNAKNINAGLFDYPVLMAADIILYKAQAVPVGEDQIQHVELTRSLVKKFNTRYGNTFPEPKVLLTRGARVMGLDGNHKMSKSRGNYVAVFENPDSIMSKFKKAKTDTGKEVRFSPDKPEISNLMGIYHAFTGKTHEAIEAEFAGKGYAEFKEKLGQTVAESLAPFRARRQELAKNVDDVKTILRDGAKKAKAIAEQTMTEVREKVGLKI